MRDEPPKDLMTTKEVKQTFDISYTLLRSWWTRGTIEKYVRGDGRVFVRRSEIEREVERRKRFKRVDP